MEARPDVRLEAGAAEWVARQGGVISLRPSPRHGCCGGTAPVPVAEARRPDDPSGWLARHIDGITVYLHPAMAGHSAPLVVRAEGVLRWRRLFVESTAMDTVV